MPYSRLSLACCASYLLICNVLSTVATAQSAEKYVVAVGRAVGTDSSAKQNALADAKRNAVEQACGVVINARSEVEDFALKKERILADVVGYITAYEVRREWDAEGIAHCEISATVATGKFEADWAKMFAHIREDMSNPRCIVVITEDNDVDDLHKAKVNGVCQSALENYFLAHGVQLMDKSVGDDVRKRDLDLAALNGNVNLLAARAAAFSADILVYGRAEAKRGGTLDIGGHTVYTWDVTLNVRAVQADSAQTLMSNTYRPSSPFKSTSNACGDEAFTKLAKDVAREVLRDIADAWQKGLTSHQIFRVQFEGCSRKIFRQRIAPALVTIPGVAQGGEGVKLREVVNNVVNAEIYWSYDISTLANAIEDLEISDDAGDIEFEVIEQSTNRIRCKVISGH